MGEGERPDTNAAATINLAFAWDYTQGKLCLDVNRNGDLTDDAVYSAEPQPGNQSSQTFTNLHLKLSPAAQSHPALVDLFLVASQGRNDLRGGLAWRSCWQGKVVLPGRAYQVGLIEHPNYLGSPREAWLLFRLWEERPRSSWRTQLSALPYPPQFPARNRAQLRRHQVPGRVGGIVAAAAVLVGVHFQHALRPIRIVLQLPASPSGIGAPGRDSRSLDSHVDILTLTMVRPSAR